MPILSIGRKSIMLTFLVACAALPARSHALGTTEDAIVFHDSTALFEMDLSDPDERRRFYDETFLLVSLQALANRDAPNLFLRVNSKPDDFWWARMTEPGAWLDGRPVERIDSWKDLLQRFPTVYEGAVVWDERVPATSNAAATLAGIENLLVLRYDEKPGSLYRELCVDSDTLKVKRRLLSDDGSPLFTGKGTIPHTRLASTGSAKNDVHRWITETLVRTGKSNPHSLGYYLDGHWLDSWRAGSPQNHTLHNLDYVIANRGVLFDLNVWTDETPVDDPTQKPGTDVESLHDLLRACWERFDGDGMIHVAGFVPWAYKYTNAKSNVWDAAGTHDPVPTEWMYAEILSSYNAYMDADALGYSSFANASFYQHFPLPDHIPQNPKPTRESLQERGILDADGHIVTRNYYAHYQGDYDAAAWLHWVMPDFWTDPTRGEVPMTWAFNPNLAERFPFGMYWLRQNRTPNDFFVAGDSGAGYINPYHLDEPREFSGLPSGVAAWEKHCKAFYDQWDITLTAFVIDGNTPGMTPALWDSYARFSPGGIVAQRTPGNQGVYKGVPYLRMFGDLTSNAENAARTIRSNFVEGRANFIFFRSILWPPKAYADIDRILGEMKKGPDFMLVDAYTLMWLIREYETNRDFYESTAPFASAQEVAGQPDAPYGGLQAILVADGPFEEVQADGVPCWRLSQREEGWRYFYMAADSGFGPKAATGAVKIKVVYRDVGAGKIRLEYDSSDETATHRGIYKNADQEHTRPGTGKWRAATWLLPDPAFQNRQNNRTDFRILSKGDALDIRQVTIRRMTEDKPTASEHPW